MSKKNIVIEPDPILRKKSDPIEKVDQNLRKLLDDMLETMYAAPGIGLAAILVIGLISWFTADGSDFAQYKDVTEATSKASSAMLTSFYILFSGAVLAVVYSLVARVIK